MSSRSEGFTLIELLAVLVILSVLGAIAVPTYLRQVDRATVKAARTSLQQINKSQRMHLLEHGTFAKNYAKLRFKPNARQYQFEQPNVADGWVSSIAEYQGDKNLPDLRGNVRITRRGEVRTNVSRIGQ